MQEYNSHIITGTVIKIKQAQYDKDGFLVVYFMFRYFCFNRSMEQLCSASKKYVPDADKIRVNDDLLLISSVGWYDKLANPQNIFFIAKLFPLDSTYSSRTTHIGMPYRSGKKQEVVTKDKDYSIIPDEPTIL
jgi:hypothetical protein